MLEIILNNRGFSDFNPLLYGREECKRGKYFGPAIRGYTLVHYVERGRGIFVKGEKTYEVNAGEAFIILPNEITYYEADKEDPWVYRWIGFNGMLSREFEALPPVISVDGDIFPGGETVMNITSGVEYILAGQLFRLASSLFGEEKKTNKYVKMVKDYIKNSYMEDIHVEGIAKSLSLNRRYLSRIFKESEGVAIKEYILSVRMEEAKRLLGGGMSVAEAAMLSGYSDLSNFSKMYKRVFKIPPSHEKRK